MDMSQVVEYGQSMTFLGSIGGLALALLGAGLAAVLLSLIHILVCSITGGVLNMVLDYVLIAVLDLSLIHISCALIEN